MTTCTRKENGQTLHHLVKHQQTNKIGTQKINNHILQGQQLIFCRLDLYIFYFGFFLRCRCKHAICYAFMCVYITEIK